MVLKSRKVFIDSSVFLAFVDRSDINHQKAAKALENLAQFKMILYTSLQNITETYTVLNKEIGLSVALEFLESIVTSKIEILYPAQNDLTAVMKLIKSNRDRQISLREAINAVLMHKRDISQIYTFTYWYNLYGTSLINL